VNPLRRWQQPWADLPTTLVDLETVASNARGFSSRRQRDRWVREVIPMLLAEVQTHRELRKAIRASDVEAITWLRPYLDAVDAAMQPHRSAQVGG
jgi:hypothetical protein